LQDRELNFIKPALTRANKLFKQRLKTGALITAAKARLIADVEGKGVAQADVIIEAIFEDPSAKQALFKSLEPRMKEGAILASNTSAIPLETLSSVLKHPDRMIGLHFFNPVAKMPLVEVVRGEASSALSLERGNAFCRQINRFPLPVKSSPGFLVNRVLAPYLMEAMRCYIEGIDKLTIDAAATEFGMPMGPIELADTVGLDVCVKVAETLVTNDVEQAKALLLSMIDEGKLGKKSDIGFYEWKAGKAVKEKTVDAGIDKAQLAQRLLKPFLESCQACHEDGIVDDADLLDAGIIFGTGFAPFLGGPLHYLNNRQD
jgi:3-hydroxyacyl-CoA dehydrogenase/enoyl-CoA hydratase/3-hydroxybutyryl-CoA epimerase